MKYSLTPFNLSAGMFLGIVIRYFTGENTGASHDVQGVAALFTLIPSIALATTLFVSDLVMQGSKRTGSINIVRAAEFFMIIMLLLLLWLAGYFKYVFGLGL